MRYLQDAPFLHHYRLSIIGFGSSLPHTLLHSSSQHFLLPLSSQSNLFSSLSTLTSLFKSLIFLSFCLDPAYRPSHHAFHFSCHLTISSCSTIALAIASASETACGFGANDCFKIERGVGRSFGALFRSRHLLLECLCFDCCRCG